MSSRSLYEYSALNIVEAAEDGAICWIGVGNRPANVFLEPEGGIEAVCIDVVDFLAHFCKSRKLRLAEKER